METRSAAEERRQLSSCRFVSSWGQRMFLFILLYGFASTIVINVYSDKNNNGSNNSDANELLNAIDSAREDASFAGPMTTSKKSNGKKKVHNLPTTRNSTAKISKSKDNKMVADKTSPSIATSMVKDSISDSTRKEMTRQKHQSNLDAVPVDIPPADHVKPNVKEASPASNSKKRIAVREVPRLPVIPKPDSFPPFEQVKEWMSTDGNQTAAQFMLDFAVLGFAKCGTSTMMFWLGNQPEIFVPSYEVTALKSKPSWELIRELYKGDDTKHLLGGGNKKKKKQNNNNDDNAAVVNTTNTTSPIRLRGFKSPNDIMDTRPPRILGSYFSKTKIIIGLRHPIWMIQSFYNHRIQNGLKMPPLNKLPYHNTGHSHLVTLGRAAYHANLIHLGKTNMTKGPEWRMIPKSKRRDMKKNGMHAFPYTPNKVYLYETAQLGDKNQTRMNQVLVDLQNFLGLESPLQSPPIHYSPGKKAADIEAQKVIDSKKANICDDQYKEIRKKLIDIGTTAQEWILTYFLQSPDVYVSNPDHFQSILEGYQRDPCEDIVSKTN